LIRDKQRWRDRPASQLSHKVRPGRTRPIEDCFCVPTDGITSCQHQTQRTLLDWLRVEYAIEKPSNKLLATTGLDSDTWVGEVKRIRGSGEEG
jgi:hypothetical protein